AASLSACGGANKAKTDDPVAEPAGAPIEKAADAISPDQVFQSLLDEHWAWIMAQNPTFATSLGVRDYDDQLGDPSLAAYEAEVVAQKEFLTRFEALDPALLSADNRLNRDLMLLELRNNVAAAAFGGKYMNITNRGGPHMSMTRLADRLPFFTHVDYQSYVKRLAAVPSYMEKATARSRAGVKAGWVQPCAPMAGYEKSISTHIVDQAEDSTFLKPFKKKPATMSDADFDALRTQAAFIIGGEIIPALEKFETFYTTEYIPACRQEIGTSSMPGGPAYYAHRVKLFTTTNQTPDEVHNIGLSEVARIRAEMEVVKDEAGFKGSFKDWLNFLRTDKQFYFKTGEERLAAAAVIAKKMDGELPNLFTRFPRMPYGVKEIPLDIAEKTTTAYYSQPAGDGSRAGYYYVNTTLLETRPKYELEALSLHEAVPGHHFQIALAQELDLPQFRKHGGFTAFVEGWGLYSERLGLETGFYQTPYTNMGRLSYEMWRACRLVVDTGIHAKGWTRQQAIDYMAENSALSLNNITTEVDRYITWPGQALAYKTGELKIRELRAFAEKELGENFDVRHFHDKVLENGAVPLSVLDDIIRSWVAATKKEK
ncbi:MAG: DUF885 domain-containing protein, partial [Parvularculaceae bacterium]